MTDRKRDEQGDAAYLRNAVDNGKAHEIMDMVREMDDVVRALGLQDSFEKPSDAIRKMLKQED